MTEKLWRSKDYSGLNTGAQSLIYKPARLRMERVEDAPLGPLNRIGRYTMRNPDILDRRDKLAVNANAGLLSLASNGESVKLTHHE